MVFSIYFIYFRRKNSTAWLRWAKVHSFPLYVFETEVSTKEMLSTRTEDTLMPMSVLKQHECNVDQQTVCSTSIASKRYWEEFQRKEVVLPFLKYCHKLVQKELATDGVLTV
jgi:hypothetical protein